MYVYSCDSTTLASLPTVALLINGYWYEFPPEVYSIPVETGICVFGMINSGAEYFLLGDIFFRSFYASFDDNNNQITFAPRKGGYV